MILPDAALIEEGTQKIHFEHDSKTHEKDLTMTTQTSLKIRILAGASVLTLALAVPALAQTAQDQNNVQNGTVEQTTNNRGPVITKDEIKQGWENTKESVKETTANVSNAVERKYEEAKAVILDEDHDGTSFDHTTYNTANTAKNLIGRDVQDANGKTVAEIHDIIIDNDGDASVIVLSDGGFFGIGGKMVALDYDKVVTSSDTAETLKPVSEAMIRDVTEFSYEPASGKVRIVPADGISLRDALDGDLVDPQNNKLATVRDIVIQDGDAESLIVSFDKTLGLGGDEAALELDDATPLRADGKVNFQLSQKQAATFENYKASVKK